MYMPSMRSIAAIDTKICYVVSLYKAWSPIFMSV